MIVLQYREKVINLAEQVSVRMSHLIKLRQAEFTRAIEKLSNLSPLNILSRGYSITFQMPQEKIIKDAAAVRTGEFIKTRLHKGEILSEVTEVTGNG